VISRLVIETSCYTRSTLAIYFNQNLQLNDSVKTKLYDICNNDGYWHSLYCVVNGPNIRETIDILFKNNYITADIRSDIESIIRNTESNLEFVGKTIPGIGQCQKDVLEDVISDYIDPIISISNDHRKIFTLLQYPFSRHFKHEITDIISLIESMISTSATSDILECLNVLNRFCWGKANMESTYLRLNQNVPSLLKQREIIVDTCLKLLNKQFKLSIIDRFYYAVEMIMMTCMTQRNIYPSKTHNFLNSILKEEANDREIYLAFVHLAGVDNVLLKGLLKCHFTSEDINIISDTFKSKTLTKVLSII
jgi:hypothetical protein